MIISGAFDYVDMLNKAADVSWKRNEVLNNNIANVDTPGYKRQDVTFSTYLETELNSTKGNNRIKTLTKRPEDMDADGVYYNVYTDYGNMSYRLDGNNVDIETENVELASNQLLYNGLIDSMSAEFGRIKTVIGN